MSKRFIIILAVIAAIFFGLVLFNKKDTPSSDNGSDKGQLTNHVYSQGTSGVTLVEYGDFNCRGCYNYFPLVQQIKEKYKDVITFQFRHLPLIEIHQNALVGAKAAEAASVQGKFWEMHDQLFENFLEWEKSNNTTPLFEKYARNIGLDINKFLEDMRSDAVNISVQTDRAEAKKQGYSSTPTFVLDGKQIETESIRTIDDLSKMIDEAIAARS